jgi:subtilase family serine protease
MDKIMGDLVDKYEAPILHIVKKLIKDKDIEALIENAAYIKRLWRVQQKTTPPETEALLIASEFLANYPQHFEFARSIDTWVLNHISKESPHCAKAIQLAREHVNMIDDPEIKKKKSEYIEFKIIHMSDGKDAFANTRRQSR